MGLTIAYWASNIVRMFYLCFPFAYLWDKSIIDGTCSNLPVAYVASSIINLLLDVVVIVLPMPVLWALRIPTSKKIAISAMFGIGIM